MSTGEAALDMLQAAFAYAERMSGTLQAWIDREERQAPPAALALVKLSISCTRKLQREIGEEFSRVTGGGGPDQDKIVAFNRRIAVLQDIIDVAEQSAHRSLHPVLSPTVTTLLRELRVDGHVLVTGTRENAAYELQFWRENDFASLGEADELSTIRLPFLLFLVPKPPLDWPMHYCLLFHEVGHAVYEHRDLGRSFKVEPPAALAQLSPDERTPTEVIARNVERDRFRQAFGSWVEEVFSDVFGLLSVGPAYLHSLCRVLGSEQPISRCSSTHPPASFRTHVLHAIATKRDMFSSVPERVRASFAGWAEEAKSSVESHDFSFQRSDDSDVAQAHSVDLTKAVEAAIPAIVTAVEQVLGKTAFSGEDGRLDMERAKRIAGLNIPAVEETLLPDLQGTSKPLRAARILASHWIAYGLEEAYSACDRRDRMQQYGERVLNALDASEAIRAWQRTATK